MPVFNWYAASSLVGYLSTGLSIGLMFPSLIVSWREGFILISGWTNAIWTTAEVFSLAGLLLVPDSLAPQYILIIWYLVADLLFVGEAIVIKGWTCCFRKRPERFARDRLKAFWVKMTSREAKDAQRQRRELSNEQKAALLATEGHMTKKTIEYKGARWRRDFIVQLAFILTGLFSIIPIWYIAFFKTGIASQPYKWEDNIVSQFDHNAYAGWIMGWLSSAIWVIGRLVDERRIKAAFVWSWNQFAPKRRHLEMPPHVPQEWGGLLNVFVVFVVFCFDNVCQLLCIFLILPEAESGEARRQYCLFQLPWILGSVSALASDMWKIKHLVEDWNEGQNKQIRQAGRWTYAIFPTEPKNKVLERTIDEIWFHPGERAKWLQMRKEYVSRHLADRNKERKERVEVDARDSADVESRMKSDLADAQQAQEEEHDSDHVQTSWADAHQKYLALQQAKKSSHRRKIERTKQVAQRAGYRAIGIEPFTANDDERRRQRKEEVLQAKETARLDFRKSKRSHEEAKDRTSNERLLQRQRRHDDIYGGGQASSNGDSVPSQELSSHTARDSRSTPPTEQSRSKRPKRSKKRQNKSDEELLLL